MVSFGESIKLGFKNTFKFGGTSTRAEYWWFALFSYITGIVSGLIDVMFGWDSLDSTSVAGGPIAIALSAVLFIPQLSLLVRRFRDTKVSPFWLIAGLVPLAGLTTWCINNMQLLNQFLAINDMSDAEVQAQIDQWANDPAFAQTLSQFAVIILLLAAFGIFQLVVTLLPSKKPKQPVVATIDY